MKIAGRSILAPLVAAALAACSSTSAGVTGATLEGTVTGASQSLLVQVPGSPIGANTDPSGRFVLFDVPAGAASLRFSGGGVDTTLVVQQFLAQEHRKIGVSLIGGRASEQHERSESDFHGTIESISAPDLVVAGRTVRTNAQTVITKEGATLTFAALAAGDRVEVDGALQADGSVLATAIEVEAAPGACRADAGVSDGGTAGGTDGGEDHHGGGMGGMGGQMGDHDGRGPCGEHPSGVRFEGFATALDSAHQTLTVGTTPVTTTSSTTYVKGDVATSFSALHVGDHLLVTGDLQSDHSVAAREIRLLGAGEPDHPVLVVGPIASLSTADLSLTIGATTVFTDTHTSWDGGGLAGFGDLAVGDRVGVKATTRADGSLLALEVHRMDTPAPGEFEARGAIDSLRTDGLDIAGVRFAVDAHTVIRRRGQTLAFADLHLGDRIELHALGRTGGLPPLATRIEVEPPH